MGNDGTLGSFNLDGYGYSKVIKREASGKANLKAVFQLHPESNYVTGTLTCFSNTIYQPDDGVSGWAASLTGFKQGFNNTNPTTYGTFPWSIHDGG